jgi:predicted RNA binding protein YcfA (HicA-like mRNA interferase family)
VTWAEVIRKLKAAGFVEVRSGKASHRLLRHPTTGNEIWVAVHTKIDAGRLGNRILREAGVEWPTRGTGPRRPLVDDSQDEGRHRRSGGSCGRPAERDEGTRLAREWQAGWPAS